MKHYTFELTKSEKKRRVTIILLLIIIITTCHFTFSTIGTKNHIIHVSLRILYLIPIVTSSIWFYFKGMFFTTSIVELIYISHIYFSWSGNFGENINQVAMLVVYIFVGILTSFLSYYEHKQRVRRYYIEQHKNKEIILNALESLSSALKYRDEYTKTHSDNVAKIAVEIGKYYNLDFLKLENLKLAARVHDIGKFGIRDDILYKPEKLNEEEILKIKKHPETAANILKSIPGTKLIADIVICHHESPNGKGYPFGLKNDEIPFEAKILSVADAFSALTEDRPYKLKIKDKEAIEILKKTSKEGKFSVDIVNTLEKLYLSERLLN